MVEAIEGVFAKDCPQYDYEIQFIDNKSTDRTREILRDICSKDKRVKAIFNVKNFGQNNSPVYGMMQTTGDCTIGMSCDFQDPVELIPKFIAEWEKGYKIVIGRKTKSEENGFVYFLRSCYYKIIRKMSDVEMIEQFTGFGLYDKSFINTLRDLDDPTPSIRGIVGELGPERKEIEFDQPERRAGKTHNNFFSLYDVAMLNFTSYTKTGLRIATFVGITMAVVCAVIAIVMLIAKLIFWDKFPAGYAPILIAIFFVGGVQLALLGFLGEYVMAINARVMKRPLVVEECRLNFDEEEKQEEEKQQEEEQQEEN